VDRDAWRAARYRGSLLDEGGLASSWAGSTQATSARSYGRWLAFLLNLGILDPAEGPAERVNKERIEAYLADLRAHGNASGTIHIRILHLCRMLAVTAPGGCPAWLGPILRMLRAAVQPSRDDRARLVPAEILLEVAFSLMDRAEAESSLSPRLRAVRYRDGLMLAILVSNALRVGNFADLELGRSFIQRGEDWWILLEASEVKNHKPINHPVAPELTPRIDRYLEVWRPIILVRPGEQHAPVSNDTGFLWVGRYGGRFNRKKVSKRISEITLRELGQALNPHLFRKLQPTELAIHDPAHVGISQVMLGHGS
jgi:integrase/recombinase XerD